MPPTSRPKSIGFKPRLPRIGRRPVYLTIAALSLGLAAMTLWRAAPTPPAASPIAVPTPRPSDPLVLVMPLPPEQSAEEEHDEPATETPTKLAAPLPPPPATRAAATVLPPPALAPTRPGEPQWLRYAVAAPATMGRPRVAIVIDDLGIDKKRTERTITLKAPLTLSFMSYATDLARLTDAARRAGHELMVHVPMEPINRAEDMGPNGLMVEQGHDEVLRRLRWDLDRFDGYVGINNHMGSLFTSDVSSMTPVMEELKSRGLLFLDSRTASSSVGAELARKLGVPSASRDVFLDDQTTSAAIAERLAAVEAIAKRHGTAIAIGHPHDATLEQLTDWLASLPAKGLVLVPVSAVVRERMHMASAG